MATGLTVGMRFPSAQVVRFCDAKAMQLIRAFPADGRWRIVVFAGDIRTSRSGERLNNASHLPFSNQTFTNGILSARDLSLFR